MCGSYYFDQIYEIKKAAFLRERPKYCFVAVCYFLDNHSFTNSGDITDSTKVYAPLLGDFTIFIAFVSLLELPCRVATVFFAIVSYFISL
jgi:hypothetical protein